MARIKELANANADLRNQVTHLVNNSRRWAAKFRNPMYAVPEKHIKKMEAEAEAYKQQTRAEISKLQAHIALLNEKVLDLTEDKCQDLFGSATGTDQIDYQLAQDHINAVPNDHDRKVVELRLSEGWKKRMASNSILKKD